MFFKSSKIENVVCGSKAEVASSLNSTSGSLANALAIPTLCF